MANSPEYLKGYRAGRQRKKRDIAIEVQERRNNALWNRVFLAMLPHALEHGGTWKIGGENCESTEMRMKLAELWTRRAIDNHMRKP